MIKYKKAEMLQAVTTLIRANDAISKVLKINPEGVIDTLIQSQEVAILLGTFIEENFEEKCAYLVELLENYCENIYQMSIGISDESLCQTLYEEIKVQLIQLSNGIQVDVPNDRKEIVFLPYKASMWDSLESIWKAADEDENTDVYVIPIPYFDKNPDGSIGEMHYEGDQFPINIQITSWQEYSIEKNKPDIIYIHNPYDSYNCVTSVHPMFYSSELEKYTNELIYVPYFVLHEIKSDDQAEIDKIKHFISTPGVIYADKIIVQSEEMRRIYINEYISWAKEQKLLGNHLDKNYQENRIFGLGSPKYDKMFSEEVSKIPKQWKEKIFIGGKKKKIIFFNTNISLLLNNGNKFVENMKRIERIFSCYSNEYTILWREHPLTYETIKSMRPDILIDYMNFKKNFIKNDWVILDENPEWQQAAFVSDCYYGAGGSLSALYLVTKRPIMITDYHYPNGILDKAVSLETMFRTMNAKYYYNEKFSNSLNLFLECFEQISDYQKECLTFLPNIEELRNQNYGKRIYDFCCR